MNFKTLFSIAALSLPLLSHAETTNSDALNPLKPLNNVRISMQRMLSSQEGRYFLNLYAGIAKPHAVLYDQLNKTSTQFKGSQKADQIVMDAVSDGGEKFIPQQLTGSLNVNSGVFKSSLVDLNNQSSTSIQFEPAFKVANKPLFTFKFYGVKADTPTQEQLLTRVDVINKTNNTVAQTLTGFSAFPNSIGYMDINFDGYYDVILSDLSQDRKLQDRRYIYWMFNPKTGQFQRSPQMEKLVGLPKLHGETKQIDYGDGVIFQVENGLLNRLDQ